jgi:putative hydrolase of the HAD superfamily
VPSLANRTTTGDAHDVSDSPRSDINPALAAGLNAVFVPHDQTWILEHEEVGPVPASAQLLVLERFSDLRVHF